MSEISSKPNMFNNSTFRSTIQNPDAARCDGEPEKGLGNFRSLGDQDKR